MTTRFPRKDVLNGLVCASLILAGCASPGKSALPTAVPPNATPAIVRAPSPVPSSTMTLPPTGSPSPRPEPTQTPVPSPTLAPTGIFPVDGVDVQTGQHAYRAVVRYTDKTFGSPFTQTVNYLLYLPESYNKDPAKKWPLMLYLHGSGSRGSDLSLVRSGGLPKPLEKVTDFPFIVVSPQCPAESSMWSSHIDALNVLLDLIQARYSVDPQRLTVTGFSMGGFGAWEFALRYPKRFAAIAPVAGGYIIQSTAVPDNLCDLKDLPVWVFHGGQDGSVAIEQATSLVDALKACHGNVRFTYYADANHMQTALRAYADPELYNWLAAQKRP